PADEGLDVLDVAGAPRAVEEDVVPVGRIEVFDRLELEPRRLDALPEDVQLLRRPQLVGIAREPPAEIRARRLVVPRGVRAAPEIINQVGDDVGRARLPRELEVLAGEHVAVEAEAEFHGSLTSISGAGAPATKEKVRSARRPPASTTAR